MAGVRATEADYVFPLDADDLVAPGGLKRLADVLDRHPEAAAAWGSIQSFGQIEYVHESRPTLAPWQVSHQNHLPICSLYRRTALVDAGGWQLPGGYEDWDLWMSLAERGWTGIGILEVTAHYRTQSGRRLSRSSQRHAERIEKLRARHLSLFAERRRNRRASPAPRLLKLTLPAIDALPLSPARKRLLAGAMTHVATGTDSDAIVRRAYRLRELSISGRPWCASPDSSREPGRMPLWASSARIPRARQDGPPDRVPPGQYLTGGLLCPSAGPTHTRRSIVDAGITGGPSR
jgi:hypothetical protein